MPAAVENPGFWSRQAGPIPGYLRQWMVATVVFVLPAVITLQLKHVGERGVRAERDLQAVITELQIQDGLDWRVVSNQVAPGDVAEPLAASRQRARELIEAVSVADDHGPEMLALLDHYAAAVDEELRLAAAGDLRAARAHDEATVDPAFASAMAALEEHALEVAAAADRARRFSDVGVLATVLLALTLTTVVQSRRQRAEVRQHAERLSEARYRALIDQSADLVLVADRGGRASYLSPSAERLLGPRSGAVELLSVVEPQDRARLAAVLHGAAPGSAHATEVNIVSAAGRRTFELSVQDLTEQASVGGLVVTAHDVTERLLLQREMEHRAMHDALTGLPNRALLAERFDAVLRSAQCDGSTVGLLLVDLDRFKEINDTFGHHYGDALLTQVGPRLIPVLRDVDTVARLGGDEFAVVLPDVGDLDGAVAAATRIAAALEAPFRVEDVDLDVEASIGVVLSGEHGGTATELLQRADIAMYVAKTQNLGVFAYDPAADGHSPAKLALLGDLRRALEGDELVVHYQPKVSIGTGDVVGVEALVRWQHPQHGLLLPDSFIPLAEHTGLIGPLARFVLRTALAQAEAWLRADQPLTVSVNLSARNLLDQRLPAEVDELLAEHGVPPALLELEVTETAITTEPVRARQLLEQLASLGVRLSIDDFGAGYTSLGQLKMLPVTDLKIDKSFVMSMTDDDSNAMIVRSVIELGHNLGLTLVAEGVETAEALQTLAEYGCDVAQGYHFARPMTAEAFDCWRADRASEPRRSEVASG